MKVILSRKGSDSTYGGIASPIFPNNDMRSIPIPDTGGNIKYSDLKYSHELDYKDFLEQLQSHNIIKKIQPKDSCHLDPDIYKDIIARPVPWKPLFGQISKAQQHLINQDIKKNDLFLFYGWFRKTVKVKNDLKYADNNNLHIIFGYLQIGKILYPKKDGFEEWMKYHPHLHNKKRFENDTNCIYVARDTVTWDNRINGSDIFNFHEKLILTKKTKSGYLSKSYWTNEFPFDNTVKISRHSESAWKNEAYFQSTPIGQEFVFEEKKTVENWAKELINKMMKQKQIT